ncbi:MAG: peptidoglycan DD-metalloendopeptidase family protein [Deltaproteobacteria bacterium]|nr:peptidoglycan DD-metalloendopeptidase family protein [Deltaproteobacteria bacterium]
MTPLDHTLSAGLLGFVVHPWFRKYLSKPKTVLLLMLAGLLPDLDYVTRLFGRDYYYNKVQNLFLSHRGFFHSLGGILFFAVLAVLFYLAFFWSREKREEEPPTAHKTLAIGGLFVAGGVLHLLEDMLGPDGPWGGLCLFFPLSESRFQGWSLYGWYDFFLIYLFMGVFLLILILYGVARFRPFPAEKRERIVMLLVAGAFLVAVSHLWMSPGYPEQLGIKKAEKVWKEYQLSILPGPLRDFSDRAQTVGMKTLFATLPNLRPQRIATAMAVAIGGLLLYLGFRAIKYLRFREQMQDRPRISPVRTFLLTLFLLVIFPAAAIGVYSRSNLPPAVTAEEVPVASGFDYPVGEKKGFQQGWNGKNEKGWYVGQSFLNPFYHPGEDWNGKGMGNTDFGQPVYAVAEGRVLFAEDCFHWGKMVLVAHRLPDGRSLFSLYAHLKDISVQAGSLVQRRQQLGTLGRGYRDATYTAHLHFEIRKGNMAGYPVTFWPRTLTYMPFSGVTNRNLPDWIREHYLEPSSFIEEHRIVGAKQAKKKGKKRSTAASSVVESEERPLPDPVRAEQGGAGKPAVAGERG